jgi:predicted metalloprotease with PDZ domain
VRAATFALVLVCGLSAVEPTILPAVEREQPSTAPCGWIGVGVTPMTMPFAQSLGMAAPYGAIFARPEPGSPAAAAGIQEGDVITAINGMALAHSGDFAKAISEIAPGALVYLTMFRNGELMDIRLMLGSSACTNERQGKRPDVGTGLPGAVGQMGLYVIVDPSVPTSDTCTKC